MEVGPVANAREGSTQEHDRARVMRMHPVAFKPGLPSHEIVIHNTSVTLYIYNIFIRTHIFT